jgi:hypothetical protein
VDHKTKRQDAHSPSKGNADFQPPRLTPLGQVTDLTRDFITPGSGDFTLTGFLS